MWCRSNLDRGRGYSTPKPFENKPFYDISRLKLASTRYDRWISRAQLNPLDHLESLGLLTTN